MESIENVIQNINKELVPHFEKKLRGYLEGREKEWLIEQIVRLTLDAHSLQSKDRQADRRARAKRVAERLARLKLMALDEPKLKAFLRRYELHDRARLIEGGYLMASAPKKGTDLITEAHRTETGNALLKEAKDLLFGLLYGSERTNTRFKRVEQELLALTVPRFKAHALDFIQATTEMSVFGTWHDPDSISDDERAESLILEMEYGEVGSEMIGHGIMRTLSLINNLEINEQSIYSRMINIEQSTLIS